MGSRSTHVRRYRKMKARLDRRRVKRLYQMQESGAFLFPAISTNDSVTKSKVCIPFFAPHFQFRPARLLSSVSSTLVVYAVHLMHSEFFVPLVLDAACAFFYSLYYIC
jgi:hypothetical protein